MPNETPTAGELTRLIKASTDAQRDGFAEVNRRLDKLVSVDLWTSEQRRVDERLKDLAEAIANERQIRAEAIKDEKAERETLETSVDTRFQRLKAGLQWVAVSVLLPVALFVANLVQER